MGDRKSKRVLKLSKSAIYKNIGGGAGGGAAPVTSQHDCDNSITNGPRSTSSNDKGQSQYDCNNSYHQSNEGCKVGPNGASEHNCNNSIGSC